MRAFAVEFVRFVAAVWGNAWRWTLRKKRNFFLSAGVLLAVVLVMSGVFQSAPKAPVAAPTPTPTPTSTLSYTVIEAKPLDGSAGGAAAGETTPAPDATAAEIPAPTEPAVDLSKPESVAQGWLTAYLSRPAPEWRDWIEWVGPYTMPEILAQVEAQAFFDPSALEGKAPTTVTETRIGEPAADAETNTPIRWSHNVTVDVLSFDGSTTEIVYGLVLAESDSGWIVTKVNEISVGTK